VESYAGRGCRLGAPAVKSADLGDLASDGLSETFPTLGHADNGVAKTVRGYSEAHAVPGIASSATIRTIWPALTSKGNDLVVTTAWVPYRCEQVKPAEAKLKLRDCVVRSARLFMEDGEREVDLEEDGAGTVIRVPLSEIAVLEAIVDSVPRSCYSATSTPHFSSPSVKRQPRRLTRACHLAVGTRGILTASPASFMPIRGCDSVQGFWTWN